jgi:hypothetical protein
MHMSPTYSARLVSLALIAACSSNALPDDAIVDRFADRVSGGGAPGAVDSMAGDAASVQAASGDATAARDGNAPLDAAVTSDAAVVPDAGAAQTVSRYGRTWVQYATVKKSQDIRVAFLDVAALATLRKTGTIPDGAVSLLEIRDPNSEKLNFLAYRVRVLGVWKAGRVSPSDSDFGGPAFTGAIDSGCEGCHSKAPGQTLFTMPSLLRFAATQRAETFTCALPNFDPCLPAVYATGG